MKHAVYAPTFNDYAELAQLLELALTAEAAGERTRELIARGPPR